MLCHRTISSSFPSFASVQHSYLFHCSRQNVTKTRKKTKSYHRILGAIFLEGSESSEIPHHQGLAIKKIPKNRKNAKKSVIFSSENPGFAAKTPKKRPFFAVSTFFW